MKILNFGSCNIDYVYALPHIVAPGETLSSLSLSTFPGGKGLNQSVALGRAGAMVYHAGCVGHDGQLLLDTLSESGVNIDYIQTLDTPSGHAIIQVDEKGENSIIIHGGANQSITPSMIDDVLSCFEEGDILLLQNEISELPYLVSKGKAKGMTVIWNVAPVTESARLVDLSQVDILLCNQSESMALAGVSTPRDSIPALLQRYPKLRIVLTLGKAGGIYQDSTQSVPYPAYRVTPVDTTAAGDTFAGYFVAALAEGKPIKECLTRGALASALSVTKAGASCSVPTKEEVETALHTLTPYTVS